MKKVTFVCWIGLVGLLLVGCDSDYNVVGQSGRAEEKYSARLERTVGGTGAARLLAETVNGRISVVGTQGDAVTVQIWKEVKASTQSEAEAFAKQVEVRVERNGDEIAGFEFDHAVEFDVSGVSRLSGTVNAGDVTITLSGPSSISLSGSGGNLVAKVSRSSRFDLSNFRYIERKIEWCTGTPVFGQASR